MIISASRRTDIPAYYSEWFFNRLKEGYVYVRNPMNPRMISSISLSSSLVDGIVFWTKNPAPMLDRLSELQNYPYYFQFTLTPYGTDIEPNVPSKGQFIVPMFRKLSLTIGKERVIWRYDPILINEKYSAAYHIKYFHMLCERLENHTEKCTISFIDLYSKILRRISPLGIRPPTQQETEDIAGHFSEIAKEHGLCIDTCSEKIDFSTFGINRASCIDGNLLERIGGYSLNAKKDSNMRKDCGCIESIDIGAYNTCSHGCIYCYANYSDAHVTTRAELHNPYSPLLCSSIKEGDIIKPRLMHSLRQSQISWFND